jgi:hypothetical protein
MSACKFPMIKLFTLKKEKDEAAAAALAQGGTVTKKTSAAELRIQKGEFLSGAKLDRQADVETFGRCAMFQLTTFRS